MEDLRDLERDLEVELDADLWRDFFTWMIQNVYSFHRDIKLENKGQTVLTVIANRGNSKYRTMIMVISITL